MFKMNKGIEELTEEQMDDIAKNIPPEVLERAIKQEEKLKATIKKNPQLAGVESENLHVLGAILFASTGGCECKACQLLAQIAQKTVGFMVDGLIKQKEAKG
jgi:hypothetical protein